MSSSSVRARLPGGGTRLSGRRLLGRALSSTAKPPTLEAALIGGIAGVMADRLRAGRAQELLGLDARLTEFALAPYLGLAVARSASPGENFAAESLK